MIRRAMLIVCLFLLNSFVALPAFAAAPPSPHVGRVSAVDGTIALRQAAGEWTDSEINDPVAAGMSVRIAPHGRAVLRVGPDMIALSGGSEADLAKLDSSGAQIVLHKGRIGVRLSGLDAAHIIEIDIPKGGVWLLTPGDYDIDAGDEHAPARVAVLDGRARYVGKGLDAAIAAGSAAVLSGGDPIEQRVEAAPADDFSAWWRAASGPADPQALRHVSAEMTGYEALDGNGSWEIDPVHGPVWFPNATPDDWAPYRDGHWRWFAPWGWTWIDDMPWAFAPSHHGRWAKIRETDALDPSSPGAARWGWVPGKLVADPLYAPALVGFLGTAGVGLSYPDAVGPAIAWFPLAPGEAYWPGYTADLETIHRINRPSVADVATIGPAVDGLPPAPIVNGAYRNRGFARAVPRSVFTSGRPVRPALLTLPERRLANAPLLAGSPQIGPPPPRPVQAAQATGAHRAATAAAVNLHIATHALGREAERHSRPAFAHAATLVRRRFARGSIRLRARSHWVGLRQRRSHVIAVASHARPRLRLATARRAPIR
jgi:hypothetical protein